MTTLAFNLLLPPLMRLKVQLALAVLPIATMFAAFGPLYLLAPLVEADTPLKDQPNGWLWLTAFLALMVVLLVAGYLLGWLANAALCRYVLGWPRERVADVFLHSKVPESWLKTHQPATKDVPARPAQVDARTSWEAQRAMGPLRYIFTRGFLAWGMTMFVGLRLVPALFADQAIDPFKLFMAFVVFSLGGTAFGAIMWFGSESNYRKAGAGK